ncbi:MAG: DUF4277 domain-containing protein [Clostridia bacterium]|nr:DUF4277 domain-containing protein [Clostridia bacterium]
MALKNPKKQHPETLNPYLSGVFSRYESRIIGNLFLLKPLMALLGLEDIVDSVCPLASNRARASVGEVCKILVLNRLNSPRPLYKVEDWADHVSTVDLFGIPSALLNEDKLGRCLELLATYSGDIEALLCLKLIRDFGVSPELVIWDSTSFYFEGAYENSEFVTFGHALEGKTDAKRVRIGMCMDAGTGIPLTSSRERGRRDDADLVVDNLESLKATLSQSGRVDHVVVADRALAGVDNVFLLDSRNTKFVAPADDDACYVQLIPNTGDDEFQEADYKSKGGEPFFIAERGICLHRELEAEERKYESRWFRAIVVKSPSKLKVDEMKRSKETETIDAWLRDVRDSKISKYHYKKLDYVEKRIDAFFSGPLRKHRKIYDPKAASDDARLDFTWSVDE